MKSAKYNQGTQKDGNRQVLFAHVNNCSKHWVIFLRNFLEYPRTGAFLTNFQATWHFQRILS